MSSAQRTLVTGGTGTLGQELLPRLLNRGHEVIASSREPVEDDSVDWRRIDLADGTGIRSAVSETDVVIHTASAPLGDTEAVDVLGTERLLDDAVDADVSNFVYISILGIEDIPYSYYKHKLTAERATDESDVPSTILRSTQFHQFLFEIFETIAWLPIWPLPTEMTLQPIDAGTVANRLVAHATLEPAGRLAPMGGPEVRNVRDLATGYREAREIWRPVIRLPIPGKTFAAFRDGAATSPQYNDGTMTWEDWLESKYAETRSL